MMIPIDEETDYIPLFSGDEEEDLKKMNIPDVLPILPLRNTVLFPGVVIPITVGRDKSLRLVQEVYRKNMLLGAVAQRDSTIDDPELEDVLRDWNCGADSENPGNARRNHFCYHSGA